MDKTIEEKEDEEEDLQPEGVLFGSSLSIDDMWTRTRESLQSIHKLLDDLLGNPTPSDHKEKKTKRKEKEEETPTAVNNVRAEKLKEGNESLSPYRWIDRHLSALGRLCIRRRICRSVSLGSMYEGSSTSVYDKRNRPTSRSFDLCLSVTCTHAY